MQVNSMDQVKAGSSPQANAAIAISLESQLANSSANLLPPLVRSAGTQRYVPGTNVPASTTVRATRRRAPRPELWLTPTLCRRWDTYRERLGECRNQPSADSVHELRVATRRLISQLDMLQLMQGYGKTEKLCDMLRRQLKSLGPLRDTHVQLKIIGQQTNRFPELLLFLEHLKRREARAIEAASQQIRDFGTKKLRKWIGGLIQDLSESETDVRQNEKLRAVALSCASRAFEETVCRRQSIDFTDARTIHRTRVAFKKFRYVVETLPPKLTGLSKRDMRVLAWYQRRMGNIQDLEVVKTSLAEFLRRRDHAEPLLEPFSRYLRLRQQRALRLFRKSADRLGDFWPPPGLNASSRVAKRSVEAGFAI